MAKLNHNLFLEMFQEPTGRGSGKRLVGFLGMLSAVFCIMWLSITSGCSDCVLGLILVLIIASCSLMGLTSITSIFKNKSITTNKQDDL